MRKGWLVKIGGVLLSVLTINGCSKDPEKKMGEDVYLDRDTVWEFSSIDDSLEIMYTGCGGLIIRSVDDVLISDPFYSNNGVLRAGISSSVGIIRIKPKPELVDRTLEGLSWKPYYQQADALLLGHAHYDHLLDVPYLLKNYFPSTLSVYGSATVGDILKPFIEGQKVVNLDEDIADEEQESDWYYVGNRMRIRAIKSAHASHLGGIHLMKGDVDSPVKGFDEPEDKTVARRWKEGQVYAYLIDVIDMDTTVLFRMHLMTSSASAPDGIPALEDGRKVDLALLCAASTQNTDGYPQQVIEQTQCEKLVLIHWEDFFRDYEKESKTITATNFRKLTERLKEVRSESLHSWVAMPDKGVKITCRF